MTSPLADGAIFAGRYRVVQCIASGGMGAVYEVVHIETERRRALKVMLPHILHSVELRSRFKREAKVAAQVDSEFIVDVFDAGVDETTSMPFLVMELLRGEELGKRLDRLKRFSAEETVSHLHQTALALDKTHKAAIVHRDLKPENLFLTQSEDGTSRVKVLDFGIAKLVAEGNTQANATRSLGTPLYMAPEQFNTGTRVSPATDIYALGMIAFMFLVGEHYWAEETRDEGNVFAFAVTAMQGPKEPATVRAARHGVTLPPAFDVWFTRMTSVDPSTRFTIASAAIVELADALGVAPSGMRASMSDATNPLGASGNRAQVTGAGLGGTAGTGVSASIAGTRGTKRGGAALAIGSVALLTLGVAAAGAVWFSRGSPPAPAGTTAAETAAAPPSPPVEPTAEASAPAPPTTAATTAAATAAETAATLAPSPSATPASTGAVAKNVAPVKPPPPKATASAGPKPIATAAPKATAAPNGQYGRD